MDSSTYHRLYRVCVNRLIVHVGPPKTATTHIQQTLFANEAVLRESGLYLPRAGRSELSQTAVSHHHLGWELMGSPRFKASRGGWQALADELKDVEAEAVLLSSEVLASAVARGDGDELDRRLLSLELPVTIVYAVRDPLSAINSGYAQKVKSFETGDTFPDFVASQLADRKQDLEFQTSRWYASPHFDFVAIPFATLVGQDPLVALLDAAGFDVPANELATSSEATNITLGPVAVAAFRLLRHYLQGLNPDVSHDDLPMRRLHQIAARAAKDAGWCDEPFWGWQPDHARRAVEQLAESNERFAQAVWHEPWPMPMPIDRPEAQVQPLELRGRGLPKIQDFVAAMGKRYIALLNRDNDGADGVGPGPATAVESSE